MPLPRQSDLRDIIEKAIRTNLANQNGDWIVTTPDNREYSFRPGENGEIEITVCDWDSEDTERKFVFKVMVAMVATDPVP